ncbi:MAG: GNAT family N-acetyltransferase [Paracoccaceae bacterium]|nr:GNAT family N-acetyltransferase [Paracoccaceae bacterium]
MKDDDLVIRSAAEADVPELSRMLAALSAEIGYESPAANDAAALARHGFGARPLFDALIAERGGWALGLAVYFPEFSTLRRRPGVYLQDLYLAPEARGLGLGRRLIAAVLHQAAAWEAVYLRLAVHDDNRDALAFYRRLGFRTDPNERAYWVEGTALEELVGT